MKEKRNRSHEWSRTELEKLKKKKKIEHVKWMREIESIIGGRGEHLTMLKQYNGNLTSDIGKIYYIFRNFKNLCFGHISRTV